MGKASLQQFNIKYTRSNHLHSFYVCTFITEHVNKTKAPGSAIAHRTRSRDISRKRSSREVDDENFEVFEKIKYPQKERSASNSPQRLAGLKPKRDSSKRNPRPVEVQSQGKDGKLGGAKQRARGNAQETKVKTAVEPSSPKDAKKLSNLVKPTTSTSPSFQNATDSIGYPDSVFKPYLSSATSSSKRAMPLRLQSLPYNSGHTKELNDLNKC